MPRTGNPWEIPEWHSLRRESVLVRHLIGSGVTALGQANYADKIGEYYTAFFGLSVGLERLGKLSLVADYAIQKNGEMPAEGVVRRYGHKVRGLMDAAEKAAAAHSLKLDYGRPKAAVALKIVDCLDAFADASRGRYANFAALGDPNLRSEEPIRKWWGEVGELILKEHYYGKAIQKRVQGRAQVVDALMSHHCSVLHFSEAGDVMQDVLTSSIRTGQTDLIQKYGRYYALTVVRWLSGIFQNFLALHAIPTASMRSPECGSTFIRIPWMTVF